MVSQPRGCCVVHLRVSCCSRRWTATRSARVVNTTLAASIVAAGEALALSHALGLDQRSVLDMLADSPIGSTVRAKRANMEAGRYPPSFKLSIAAKDMRLAVDAADHAGTPLKTAETVRRWLDEAADHGRPTWTSRPSSPPSSDDRPGHERRLLRARRRCPSPSFRNV